MSQVSQIKDILKFEDTLKTGDEVQIRWTNDFDYFAARAEIIRVNRSSVRARLLEQAGRKDYTPGREINVPRIVNAQWTANNGVFPVAVVEAER